MADIPPDWEIFYLDENPADFMKRVEETPVPARFALESADSRIHLLRPKQYWTYG